jgi:hypothetical protein
MTLAMVTGLLRVFWLRIDHVEKFLTAMRAKRDEVVRLLMWEIGKDVKRF